MKIRYSRVLVLISFAGSVLPAMNASAEKVPTDLGSGIVSLDRAGKRGGFDAAVGSLSGSRTFRVVKFTPTGKLDRKFGNDGSVKPFRERAFPKSQAQGVSVAPDGHIAVVGYNDPDVNAGPQAYQGRIIVMLDSSGSYVRRFAEGGKLVTPPIGRGQVTYSDADFQTRHRLIVVGGEDSNYGFGQSAIVHAIKSDGSIDRAFGQSGRFSIKAGPYDRTSGLTQFNSVRVLPNHKILIAGFVEGRPALVQLTRNGIPDSAFGRNGVVMTQRDVGCSTCGDYAYADFTRGPHGTIVLGNASQVNSLVVQRFTRSGQRDRRFGKRSVSRISVRQTRPALAKYKNYRRPSALFFGGIARSKDGKLTIAATVQGNVRDDKEYPDQFSRAVIFGMTRTGKADESFGNRGMRLVTTGDAGATRAAYNAGGNQILVGGVKGIDQRDFLSLTKFRR